MGLSGLQPKQLSKEDILKRYRANVRQQFDMPDLSDIAAITYP